MERVNCEYHECRYLPKEFRQKAHRCMLSGDFCNDNDCKGNFSPIIPAHYSNLDKAINFADTSKEENKKKNNSRVITLCGSTKFKDEFLAMLQNLTLCGWIVLLPGYFGHSSNIPITDTAKEHLDNLHKEKIDMSDAIYVINKDGYIGESTKREIEYARAHNKEVIYFEEVT